MWLSMLMYVCSDFEQITIFLEISWKKSKLTKLISNLQVIFLKKQYAAN